MWHPQLRKPIYILTTLFVVALLGVTAYARYTYLKLSDIIDSMVANEQVASLEKQVASLESHLQNLTDMYADLADQPREVVRQQIIREKSQDELLTEAVARVAPAVVSVVITKDVPQLEIVYENPFGDDPFFRDFGIRIPRYQQRGTEEQQVGAGTGFILNIDGYIATNRHVVNDTEARYTVLLSDGTQQPATVIYRDEQIDFAVLKIQPGEYTTVTLGSSANLKLGQSVFAIGNALGEYSNSVSTGIVSGLNRDISAFDGSSVEDLTGVIQTDAAINPGNSGGPLSDFSGKVVGINVATVQGSSNISFAVPVDFIKSILDEVAQ